MATLVSYDQNGKKLSFANWISMISPEDTPFVSMTGKESINQTLFQWQTDSLAAVNENNAVVEGSAAVDGTLGSTTVLNNVTQILRKVVKVSDTANTLANYGRGRELMYQMEKAGKEIKRDLEVILLSDQEMVTGSSTVARKTAGFQALVADLNQADPDTGAVVHKETAASGVFTEDELFDITLQLYTAGSEADIIMIHPKHAVQFAELQEKATGGAATRVRLFENTKSFIKQVNTITDPLGQTYKIVVNRWMPEDAIYFFRASDWTQMVLRAPKRTELAKDGSYEKWMIEMEVGLRHRNPFASGILKVKA